jgi:hypothetical protein
MNTQHNKQGYFLLAFHFNPGIFSYKQAATKKKNPAGIYNPANPPAKNLRSLVC